MPVSHLSPETQPRVELLFPPGEREEASRLLLEECGNNLPFLENLDEYGLERYLFAALQLSQGNLDRLKQAVELAKTDWRDLLMAASDADDKKARKG